MKAHITISLIKSLRASEKPYEVVDDEIKGFLARVQPTGTIAYYFSYRSTDGARKRTRLGKHPGVTAIVARKAAEKLNAAVVQGGDPQVEKKKARAKRAVEIAAREKAKHETLKGFIELKYADWAVSHQKRGNETLQLLHSNFKPFYNKKLSDITAWDIQSWRSGKEKAGLASSTINRRVTTLKAVLNKAVEWDVISVNPLNKIKPIKIDRNSRVRYLTSKEESSLRLALDQREADIRKGRMSGNAWREVRGYKTRPTLDAAFADYLKPMVLLALNTGLRRGELFNLTWDDVDLSRKQLTVEGTTSKSGQTRHIPLNREAHKFLIDWQAQSGGKLVFSSPVSNARFDNIKRSWEGLRDRAKLTNFVFHDLRHTFASKLVMANESLYVVKELMGHSTIQMTEKYAHLAPEHKASAVERLVAQSDT
jgi:integrase